MKFDTCENKITYMISLGYLECLRKCMTLSRSQIDEDIRHTAIEITYIV